MKLLFAAKTLAAPGGAGGAERVLRDVTAGLAARGHEIVVLSFDPDDAPDFYAYPAGVLRLRAGDHAVAQRTSPLQMIERIRRSRAQVRAVTPDVAVGFMHSAYVMLSLALARSGIPVVGSEHIGFHHYRARPLEASLISLATINMVAMTAVSASIRQSFPWWIRRKMAVVPNPVDLLHRDLADVVGSAGRKLLLTVGRLEPQKDQATLIRAFHHLAGQFPDWNLRIVGEGSLRRDLERLAGSLGLADRVQFAGMVKQVEREYARAQLFVIPSLYESFGLVTAEALAHGLPAVGFRNCPGTNEVIHSEVNGILVEGASRVEALAEGLARLMDSSELRRRYASAAPGSVLQFGIGAVVDAWEDLLTRIVAKPAAEVGTLVGRN